jgi:hypothetical protein
MPPHRENIYCEGCRWLVSPTYCLHPTNIVEKAISTWREARTITVFETDAVSINQSNDCDNFEQK